MMKTTFLLLVGFFLFPCLSSTAGSNPSTLKAPALPKAIRWKRLAPPLGTTDTQLRSAYLQSSPTAPYEDLSLPGTSYAADVEASATIDPEKVMDQEFYQKLKLQGFKESSAVGTFGTVSGLGGDSPDGGMRGFVLSVDGKLRVVNVLFHHELCEEEDESDCGPNNTFEFRVFISDIVEAKKLLSEKHH